VTENDFEALGIRLGDRRKLQREIARRQLWPDGSPLPTPDELREFTLSRSDGGSDMKNGIQHIVSEAEVASTLSSSPAREVSIFLFIEKWISNDVGQVDQEVGDGIVAETPESSDSIPTLELDAEMNDFEEYVVNEDMNPSFLSAQEVDSKDDITPRAGVGGDAVSSTLQLDEKPGYCIEHVC